MKVTITKPLRMKFAKAIALVVDEVFGRAFGDRLHRVEQSYDPDDIATVGWPEDRHVYDCATGKVSIAIEVAPNMVTLYCRLSPDYGATLTEDEKALCRLINGGGYPNGKCNLHLMPNGKVDVRYLDQIMPQIARHFLTLKHGRLPAAKEVAA